MSKKKSFNSNLLRQSMNCKLLWERLLLYPALLLAITITAITGYAQYKEVIIHDTALLSQYKNQIPLFIIENKKQALAKAYQSIADYYYIKSQPDSAVKYYTLANREFEAIKDSLNLYKCHHRIGSYLSRSTELQNALFWLLPAIEYFEKKRNYLYAAHASMDVSTAYKNADKMDMREKYISKAGYFNSFANDTLLSIIIHTAIASDARKKGNRQLAIIESQKAVELAGQSGYPFFQKISLVNLADDYLYENNLPMAEKMLAEAEGLKHRGVQFEEAYHQAMLAIKKGEETQAKKRLQHFRHLADSIIKTKENENFAEQIARFETEKKQAMITFLEKESKLKAQLAERRKRFIYTLAAGLIILVTAGWYVIYNISKRRNLELKLLKQEEQFAAKIEKEKDEKLRAEFNKQLAEVQLTALNAQMNPHFIFNCMNSIQKYVLKNEKERALGFLQNFSDLMRIVLDNSAKQKVQLDEEINMLDKYILLEQQRLDNRFIYRIDIEESLQTVFFEIPGMIIQPYVENAIWHGLMNKPDIENRGLLTLAFSKEDDYIKCIITDNGVGRAKAAELTKSKSPGHKSYGMAIAQRRLSLLQQEDIEIPQIVIDDLYDARREPCGTRVTIFIKSV